MKKKFVIFLGMTLAFSLLTGCGDKEPQVETPSENVVMTTTIEVGTGMEMEDRSDEFGLEYIGGESSGSSLADAGQAALAEFDPSVYEDFEMEPIEQDSSKEYPVDFIFPENYDFAVTYNNTMTTVGDDNSYFEEIKKFQNNYSYTIEKNGNYITYGLSDTTVYYQSYIDGVLSPVYTADSLNITAETFTSNISENILSLSFADASLVYDENVNYVYQVPGVLNGMPTVFTTYVLQQNLLVRAIEFQQCDGSQQTGYIEIKSMHKNPVIDFGSLDGATKTNESSVISLMAEELGQMFTL